MTRSVSPSLPRRDAVNRPLSPLLLPGRGLSPLVLPTLSAPLPLAAVTPPQIFGLTQQQQSPLHQHAAEASSLAAQRGLHRAASLQSLMQLTPPPPQQDIWLQQAAPQVFHHPATSSTAQPTQHLAASGSMPQFPEAPRWLTSEPLRSGRSASPQRWPPGASPSPPPPPPPAPPFFGLPLQMPPTSWAHGPTTDRPHRQPALCRRCGLAWPCGCISASRLGDVSPATGTRSPAACGVATGAMPASSSRSPRPVRRQLATPTTEVRQISPQAAYRQPSMEGPRFFSPAASPCRQNQPMSLIQWQTSPRCQGGVATSPLAAASSPGGRSHSTCRLPGVNRSLGQVLQTASPAPSPKHAASYTPSTELASRAKETPPLSVASVLDATWASIMPVPVVSGDPAATPATEVVGTLPTAGAVLHTDNTDSAPVPGCQSERSEPVVFEELQPGVTVSIGQHTCRITQPLGMGSFGVVWAAECIGVGEVAIKEIQCASQKDLSLALHEAKLLYKLSMQGSAAGQPRSDNIDMAADWGSRIPAFIAYDVFSEHQQQQEKPPDVAAAPARLRFAMSRLHGEPLDKHVAEWRAHVDAACRSAEGQQTWPLERQMADAFRYARQLVVQLAPAMRMIAPHAYHRDVNGHNILVSLDNPTQEPRYGLVDFGLAVDAGSWRDAAATGSDQGRPGDWRYCDVGGDCRYWPTSAWLLFEVGCHGLAECIPLCLEYQELLDFQGLGITCMQVLAEMLRQPTSEMAAGLPESLRQLIHAWEHYWQAATTYWTALLDTFRNKGDWNILKQEFVAARVHEDVAAKLAALRAALEACRASSCGFHAGSSPTVQELECLFDALLLLISCGEDRPEATTWEQVAACFELVEVATASNIGEQQASSIQSKPAAWGIEASASDCASVPSGQRPAPTERPPFPPPQPAGHEQLFSQPSTLRSSSKEIGMQHAALSAPTVSSSRTCSPPQTPEDVLAGSSPCPPSSKEADIAGGDTAVAADPSKAAALLSKLDGLADRVAELMSGMEALERQDRQRLASYGAWYQDVFTPPASVCVA
eukprot:TRINITY_DN47510_c0_g1_i2.p1 TRINITY_DN47510_c0_g1~~TRINITY_DN47510_c0_g1_i2.p1  ORF type:complete len:1049 (+),score=173.69 TRINITY_DN47510_c0_g1_i2:80-3226(+)